jgi:hypothetical protein
MLAGATTQDGWNLQSFDHEITTTTAARRDG